jgi:uncharacterized RDD family membrane protein YckC
MNFLRRCFAYAIDLFLLSAIMMIYFSFNGTASESGGGYTPSNLELIGIIAGWYAYFIFLETTFNNTLGKLIFKLRVVKLNGSKPSFFDILKRRSFDSLELIMISIIAPIMILATNKEQRLGDLIANTTVVRK